MALDDFKGRRKIKLYTKHIALLLDVSSLFVKNWE